MRKLVPFFELACSVNAPRLEIDFLFKILRVSSTRESIEFFILYPVKALVSKNAAFILPASSSPS